MPINLNNPKIVIYMLESWTYDDFINYIDKFNKNSINVLILTFFFLDDTQPEGFNIDAGIQSWINLTSEQRQTIKQQFRGIIMASYGGAAFSRTILDKQDSIWKFITDHGFDGLDIDDETNAADATIAFCDQIAVSKPNDRLLSIVPQGVKSTLDDIYLKAYMNHPESYDWIGIQYYNGPDFNCQNNLYISERQSYPDSILGLLTGKSLNAVYCRDKPPSCERDFTIPASKLVMGACSTDCSGNNFRYTDMLKCIQGIGDAVANNNDYAPLNKWLENGGVFVWALIRSTSAETDEIINSLGMMSAYFGTKDPDCANVSCGEYGTCSAGKCICDWGTSGLNCELLPSCGIRNVSFAIEENVNKERIPLFLILGLVLIIVALGTFLKGVISLYLFLLLFFTGLLFAIVLFPFVKHDVSASPRSQFQCDIDGSCSPVQKCQPGALCVSDSSCSRCPKPVPKPVPSSKFYCDGTTGGCIADTTQYCSRASAVCFDNLGQCNATCCKDGFVQITKTDGSARCIRCRD